MSSHKRTRVESHTHSKMLFATLSVELIGAKKLNCALASALSPEAVENSRFSFSVSLKNNGRTMLLNFSAKDLVSLRAGMNTILRLASSALTIISANSCIEL